MRWTLLRKNIGATVVKIVKKNVETTYKFKAMQEEQPKERGLTINIGLSKPDKVGIASHVGVDINSCKTSDLSDKNKIMLVAGHPFDQRRLFERIMAEHHLTENDVIIVDSEMDEDVLKSWIAHYMQTGSIEEPASKQLTSITKEAKQLNQILKEEANAIPDINPRANSDLFKHRPKCKKPFWKNGKKKYK